MDTLNWIVKETNILGTTKLNHSMYWQRYWADLLLPYTSLYCTFFVLGIVIMSTSGIWWWWCGFYFMIKLSLLIVTLYTNTFTIGTVINCTKERKKTCQVKENPVDIIKSRKYVSLRVFIFSSFLVRVSCC